ncbi:hypothetical protein [Hansschlegelia plantiphila]|uniref:Uncharacterized protein n=1 Tax=Hansschlegelia plantiphila TaxID=374655 RepID=A0A9W6J5K6_9HYPH|nr:hypothetical protein [Hansschlegelia plantiphila]GLK69635.1 hypothetical protein GCM10008179_32730 [Hansschlegelia plantiphila]
MPSTVKIAPPYSLFFISDPDLGEAPEPSGAHLKWTDSVVCISCLSWMDGETSVTLGAADEVGLHQPPVFDRLIVTPHLEIVVTTVELDVILRASVPSSRTRVRIWENHPSEPDIIVIGLG